MSPEIKGTLKITKHIIITLKITKAVIMGAWIMALMIAASCLIINYLGTQCDARQAQLKALHMIKTNNGMIKKAWKHLL